MKKLDKKSLMKLNVKFNFLNVTKTFNNTRGVSFSIKSKYYNCDDTFPIANYRNTSKLHD